MVAGSASNWPLMELRLYAGLSSANGSCGSHPALDEAQRSAIERDYGMTNGVLTVKARAALSFYLIRRLNLDLDNIPPERKQIALSNLDEVERIQRVAKEETRLRVNNNVGGKIRSKDSPITQSFNSFRSKVDPKTC